MIQQKRRSWEPLDFDHYAEDHDSSTSSIRSSHLRRESQERPSSFISHLNNSKTELNEYDRRRLLPPLMPSASAFERPTTPSVFDRLAQTPTRSSIAKKKTGYRHSSGSVEDLRHRWEADHQQRPSSALNYF